MYMNCEDSVVWMEDPETANWIAEICAEFGPVETPERILMDCIRKIKEFLMADLRDEIKRPRKTKTMELVVDCAR